MSFVQDVLTLVLPGALFNLLAHAARLRLRRVEGYALLFYTLLAGWVIQAAAGLVNDLLIVMWDWIALPRLALEADAYTAATITGGIICALLAAAIVNRLWSLDRVSRDVAAASGEFMELVYQVAIAETSPVEVTLDTGKSYVGIPLASRLAVKDEGDLWLVPLMSGHRDERQELRITTNYAAKLDEEVRAKHGLSLGDLVVAVRKSQIVSARPFDVELYQKLFEAH